MTTPLFRNPCVILNPRAASGKAQRLWSSLRPVVETTLGQVDVRFTEAPNHAAALAKEALQGGVDLVVVVGGDGTFNEVVNGYLSEGLPINPDASLAYCPAGTGSDFRRSAGIPRSPYDAIKAIAEAPVRKFDACGISFTTPNGDVCVTRGWLPGRPSPQPSPRGRGSKSGRAIEDEGRSAKVSRERGSKSRPTFEGQRSYAKVSNGDTNTRYFANVASFGVGGEVSEAAKRNFLTAVNGRAAFLWATATTLLRYRAKDVSLTFDDEEPGRSLRVMQVALGNGAYHGGGMNVCPLASLESGCIDVTVIRETGFLDFLRSIRLLYSGNILSHPNCAHYRVTSVTATSTDRVLVEVDGETVGRLPCAAWVLPGVLSIAGTGVAD